MCIRDSAYLIPNSVRSALITSLRNNTEYVEKDENKLLKEAMIETGLYKKFTTQQITQEYKPITLLLLSLHLCVSVAFAELVKQQNFKDPSFKTPQKTENVKSDEFITLANLQTELIEGENESHLQHAWTKIMSHMPSIFKEWRSSTMSKLIHDAEENN